MYTVPEDPIEDVLKEEVHRKELNINQLPSCARICINVLVHPEEGSCSLIKNPVE